MSSIERVNRAIRLETSDRVPVVINGEAHFAKVGGISPVDFFGTTHEPPFNMDLAENAFRAAWTRYGGWDGVWRGSLFYLIYSRLYPPESSLYDINLPGVDYTSDSQACFEVIEDKPVMDENGYNIILKEGLFRFLNFRKMGIIRTLFRPLVLQEKIQTILEYWYSRGISWWGPAATRTPIEILCYMRGLKGFLVDTFRQLEKIKETSDALIDGLIASTLIQARRFRKYTNLVFIACHRGGNTYFSPRRFCDLYLPYLKKLVNALAKEGFYPFLHMDGEWTLNLEYLRELPAKSVVIELDGATDIFKAKKILGDHLCIKGDVPASLLALGSRLEVENYCKKLIELVGEGSGFILSNGCEVPINAKIENVETLLNTAKTYGGHR